MSGRHFRTGEVEQAKALVMRFHYSRRWPQNVHAIGTWHEDGGLFGDSGPAMAACVFSTPPTRWSEEVLELSRLVRHDECDWPLSGLISRTVKFVKGKGVADLLVSFADMTQGHHGGIYQACSWNYTGTRRPRLDGVVVDGQFIPGRTANHKWGTQSPTRLRALGVAAEAHYDEGKALYWKALNRSGRRKAVRLDLGSAPYPKPSAEGVAA